LLKVEFSCKVVPFWVAFVCIVLLLKVEFSCKVLLLWVTFVWSVTVF
jgi:hypothetical protein